jgi:hypothetical protein
MGIIMNDIYVKGTWAFTQGACFALRGQGINLSQLDTSKGFLIPAAALDAAGVKYVPGSPETKGLLTLVGKTSS